MKKIRITIRPNGEISAETLGIKGKQCLKYIAPIERLTDAASSDSEFTSEYLESEETLVYDNVEEVEA